MIFIAGVHGVGKSTFAERLERKAGIKCYRASALIESGGYCKNPFGYICTTAFGSALGAYR